MNCRQFTFLAILFFLLSFGGYACDNTQVKIVQPAESTLDSTSHQMKSNVTSDLIRCDSTSLIFLTFFYGMSRIEFQAESERLISTGELIKMNGDIIFEPVIGAQFNLFFNKNPWYGYDKLDRVELNSNPITEKTQKDLASIFKEKYGNLFIKNHKSYFSPETNNDQIYAVSFNLDYFTWQLKDGRKIELEIFSKTRAYLCRNEIKAKVYAVEDILTNRADYREWIRLHSQKTIRGARITYLSKEYVKEEKDAKNIEKIEETNIKSEQYKRIEKNKKRI